MKKFMYLFLLTVSVLCLFGCKDNETVTPTPTPTPTPVEPTKPVEKTPTPEVETHVTEIVNGGFETGDLSGWTVLWGDAFDDDSVSSRKTFSYSYDANHDEISINHSGNWYLSGKGFDLRKSNNRTGAIKSSNFYLKEKAWLLCE